MLKMLQTLVILWEKTKFKRTIELETLWVADVVEKNKEEEKRLRKELASLHKKMEHTPATKEKMLLVENRINEIKGWEKQFLMSAARRKELTEQIAVIKGRLFK